MADRNLLDLKHLVARGVAALHLEGRDPHAGPTIFLDEIPDAVWQERAARFARRHPWREWYLVLDHRPHGEFEGELHDVGVLVVVVDDLAEAASYLRSDG